jgi:hypothetical protein
MDFASAMGLFVLIIWTVQIIMLLNVSSIEE